MLQQYTSYMFDLPCLSPCCKGEIRWVLAVILGQDKALAKKA